MATMETNDKKNEWVVSIQELSTWDMENGVSAVGEDGNEDTVRPFNIPSECRITSGQMKGIWRGDH
jgi:hypothetical protein